jgi:hypothetical protein
MVPMPMQNEVDIRYNLPLEIRDYADPHQNPDPRDLHQNPNLRDLHQNPDPRDLHQNPDPRYMRQGYPDGNYHVADEINERETDPRSVRYDGLRSRSRSPSYPRIALPPSSHSQSKNRDRTPSSVDVSRKRNRRSEEPEIYDVSKDGKEIGTLNRWMAYCRILADRLDKMSEKQQAFARMKIEEAMYEAEFGPHPQQGGSSSQNAPFTGTLYPVGFVPTQ